MSQRPADEDDPNLRHRSRSAGVRAVGAIAQWGLFVWQTPGMLLVLAVCAVGALVMVGLLAVLGVAATTVSDDVRYQCESAVGPDPSASATVTPATRDAGTETADITSSPTADPYASLEPDDGDSAWETACFSALKHAPYQAPPVGSTNDGAAADCAARLALDQVGQQIAPAPLVRFVVYRASTASLTGRCEQPPPVTDSPADAVAPTVELPPASTCPDSRTVMLMPDTVAAQGVCGQRVDLAAVSTGDLVFWDHRDSAPTRVGIAVGPTELVTADAAGQVVRQAIPVVGDLRIKRVLPPG
jgi:hypothetical protein